MQNVTESAGWKLLKDILIPVFMPLVAASLTLLGVAITLRQSTQNTVQTLVTQTVEGRLKAIRDERLRVYEDFLKAANSYQWATLSTQVDCARLAHNGDTVESALKCSELIRRQVMDSFPQLKTAADKVKIFGSEQASRLVADMLKKAPHSAGTNGRTFEQSYDALLALVRFESTFATRFR